MARAYRARPPCTDLDWRAALVAGWQYAQLWLRATNLAGIRASATVMPPIPAVLHRVVIQIYIARILNRKSLTRI